MSIQTLSAEISQLISGNTIYARNRANWQFLLESYVGGDVYKLASHLTRYANESDPEYTARLRATPLHNHCKSIISVYTSFLFRKNCVRNLGTLNSLPETEDFLNDADFDGRSLNAFLKDVAIWSSVFGHAWVLVTKPAVPVNTRAEEQALGIRPYLNLISPLAMLDWKYERDVSGRYVLSYIKYQEDINGSVRTIKEWTRNTIITTVVDVDNEVIEQVITEQNSIGVIPAVICYSTKTPVRGIGISDIADIANLQRFIYNAVSEIEQSIRLNTHPSLVKTPDTQAGIGAGSIIHMPESLDPGLKPYYLEYSSQSIDSIVTIIKETEIAIDKLANTGAIRASEARSQSGIALESEFQLLNARLSEKADNLQLAEEGIWRLFALYQNQPWNGIVEYPDSFNIRDAQVEIQQLKVAKDTATNQETLDLIDNHIREWLENSTNTSV